MRLEYRITSVFWWCVFGSTSLASLLPCTILRCCLLSHIVSIKILSIMCKKKPARLKNTEGCPVSSPSLRHNFRSYICRYLGRYVGRHGPNNMFPNLVSIWFFFFSSFLFLRGANIGLLGRLRVLAAPDIDPRERPGGLLPFPGLTSPPRGGRLVGAEGDAAAGVVGYPDVAKAVDSKVMESLIPDDVGIFAFKVSLGKALEGQGIDVCLVVEECWGWAGAGGGAGLGFRRLGPGWCRRSG